MSALMEQQDFLRDLNQVITGRRVAQFMPPADILVDDGGVSVYMDVPGIRGEDLAIELENDILSIRGDRPFPYEDRGDAAIRRIERGFGSFERSLRVPQGLNPDAVQANLTDGVLELRIPKPESMKPRRIPIHAHDGDGDGSQPQVIEGSAQSQSA